MNAHDVLMYGHLWVHKHLEGLTDDQCLVSGVCGFWSVKDIIAHLASYEYVLVEVLLGFVDPGPTPTLDQLTSLDGDAFNAAQVGARQNKTVAEVLADYDIGYNRAISLLPRLDPDFLRQPGTLPWYGKEYSIEDLIVYQYYGHKREHMAQVAVYRDTLKPA
jgi:hypothetical protein